MKHFVKVVLALGATLLPIWLGALAHQIIQTGDRSHAGRVDAAVVLGAAVYRDRPSPVFAERINHAVRLYRSKRVRRIIFTGGYAYGAQAAEAQVARAYAVRRGVAPQHILTETRSHTTHENLLEARALMRKSGLKTALIVSDPLHLKRALRMALDLGIASYPSATPTTRYRSVRARAGFLLRELYFYNHYLVTGN
jgi:uncharacterized SAM-binding protein YcdF (DUF218 family)